MIVEQEQNRTRCGDARSTLERAARGDAEARRCLVEEHRTAAFRVALAVARNPHDAEEATQVAFVKAFRALSSFDRDRDFRPWLLRIVANETHSHLRRSTRQAAVRERLARASVEEPTASVESVVTAAEERARVRAALRRLPEFQRDAIVLRFFFDFSEREAAAALGVPEGTVKSRVFNGLARLREELDHEHAFERVEARAA